jgi:hypothetical protein
LENIKKIAVITAFSAGLIFSVLSIGLAAFAQQENATSSAPSTTGQITKGEIVKGAKLKTGSEEAGKEGEGPLGQIGETLEGINPFK